MTEQEYADRVNDEGSRLASMWLGVASKGTRKQVSFQLESLRVAALIILGTEIANVEVNGGTPLELGELLASYQEGITGYAKHLKQKHLNGTAEFSTYESDPSEH